MNNQYNTKNVNQEENQEENQEVNQDLKSNKPRKRRKLVVSDVLEFYC